MYNLAGFVILLLLSFGLTLAIWAAVSKSLKALLDQVVKLPDGTTFYVRSFLILILLGAAAGANGPAFNLKITDPFMEYVWRVTGGLEDVCQYLLGILLGYVALVTVLVIVLRFRHEQ